jgi:nucleotide-binding universal stress UspA family protein
LKETSALEPQPPQNAMLSVFDGFIAQRREQDSASPRWSQSAETNGASAGGKPPTREDEQSGAATNDVAARSACNHIPAEVQIVEANDRPVEELLADIARERAADLVVMGAYGRSHLREALFGGCSQSFARPTKRSC